MKFVIGCVLVVLCVFLCYKLTANMACDVFLCCVLVVFGSLIIRFDDCNIDGTQEPFQFSYMIAYTN
jgi:hypothetical protein